MDIQLKEYEGVIVLEIHKPSFNPHYNGYSTKRNPLKSPLLKYNKVSTLITMDIQLKAVFVYVCTL